MYVQHIRNPNQVLSRLLPLGPMKRRATPSAFIYSHPSECVVTWPGRDWDVAGALIQALQAILQMQNIPWREMTDACQAEVNLMDGTKLLLIVQGDFLNVVSFRGCIDLNKVGEFEASMLQQVLVAQYAENRLGRAIQSHTQVICDLLLREKVADPPHQFNCKEPPTTLIEGDIITFEKDVRMLIDEGPILIGYKDPFVRHIAVPVLGSGGYSSQGDKENALRMLHACGQHDWAVAAANWVYRENQ